jgi:hypothetical protein
MTTYVRKNAEGMTAEELAEYLKMIQQQELTADFGAIPTPEIPAYTPVAAEEFANIESTPAPYSSGRLSPNDPATEALPTSTISAVDRLRARRRPLNAQLSQLPWNKGFASEFADPNVTPKPVLRASLPSPGTSRATIEPITGGTFKPWDSVTSALATRVAGQAQQETFSKLRSVYKGLPEAGEPIDAAGHGYTVKTLANEAYEAAIAFGDDEANARQASLKVTNKLRRHGISEEQRDKLAEKRFGENLIQYFTKDVPRAIAAKTKEGKISIPAAQALMEAKDLRSALDILIDDPRVALQVALSSFGRAYDPIVFGILGTVIGSLAASPIAGGATGVGIGARRAELINGFEEQLRFAGERRGIEINWNTLEGLDHLLRNDEIVEEALNNLEIRANTVGAGMLLTTAGSGMLAKKLISDSKILLGLAAALGVQSFGEGAVELTAQGLADEPPRIGAVVGEVVGSWATSPVSFISGAVGANQKTKMEAAAKLKATLERQVSGAELNAEDTQFLAELYETAEKIAKENYPNVHVEIIPGEIVNSKGELVPNAMGVLSQGKVTISLKSIMEAMLKGEYSDIKIAIAKVGEHEVGEHLYATEAEAVSDFRRFENEIMAWLQKDSAYENDFPMLGKEDVIEQQLADGVITEEQYRYQLLELRRQQKLAAEEFRGSITSQEYSALWQKAKELATGVLPIEPSIKTEVRTRQEKRLKGAKERTTIPEHLQKFRPPADVEAVQRTLQQDFDGKTIEATAAVYMKVSGMNDTQVRYRNQNDILAKVIRRELNESNIDPEERIEINELIKRVKTAFGAVYGKKAGINELLEDRFKTQDAIRDEWVRLMRLAQRNDEAGIEDSIVSELDDIAAEAQADIDVQRQQSAVSRYEKEKGAARGYTFEKNVKHVDRGLVTPAVARKLLEARLEEGSIDQEQFNQKMEGVSTIESEARGRFPPAIREKLANTVWDERNTEKISQDVLDIAEAESRLALSDREVIPATPQTYTSIAQQEAFDQSIATKEALDQDKVNAKIEAEKQAMIDESKVTRLEPDKKAIAEQIAEDAKVTTPKKSVDASWIGTMEDPTWAAEDQEAQADIDNMSALDYEEYVKEWGDESTMLDGNDVYMMRAGGGRVEGGTGENIGNDAEGRMLGIGDTVVPVDGGEIVQIVGVYEKSTGSAPVAGLEGKVLVEDKNGIGTYIYLKDFKHTDPPAGVTRDRIPKGFADFLKNSGIPLGQFRNPDGKLSVTKLAANRDKWQSKLDAVNKAREVAGEKPLKPGNAIDRPWAMGQSPDRAAANRNEAVTTAMNDAYKEYGVDFINEHMRELVRTTGPQPGHHHPGNYLPLQRVISRAKHAFANNKKYAPEEDVINFESRKNADKPLALMMQWLNGRQTESVKQFKIDHPLWHAFEGAIAILRKGSRDESTTLEEVLLEGARYLRAHDRHPDAPKGEIPNLGALDTIPTSTSTQIRAGMNHAVGMDVFMKRKEGKKGSLITNNVDSVEASTKGNFVGDALSLIFGRPTAAVAAFNRVSPFTLEKGDVPSADDIANRVQVHHSSTMRPDDLKEGTDYIQDVSIKTGELYSGLSRIVSSLTNNVGVISDKVNSQIVDHLSGKDVKFSSPTVKKAAEDIKVLIEGVYTYGKDRTKDLDSPLDLRGNADTLLPRVWNIDYLATKAGRNRFLMVMRKSMGPAGKEKLTPSDLYNIVINSGGLVQGEWTNNKPSQVTSKVDLENDERAQEYLDSVPAEVLVDAGLVITDLQAILPRFIEKAVRRTEYSKIFGKNDEILRGLITSGVKQINTHNDKVLQLDDEGRPTQLLDAKKFEKMAWELSQILRHQYGYNTVGVTTRKNIQKATNTATMLKGLFFTFASIPEFLTPILKKGMRPDQFAVDFTLATTFATYKAMSGIGKLLLNKHLPAMRKHSTELTGVLKDAALLRELGVMDIGAMGDAVATRYTNQAFAPGGIKSGARNTLGAKVPKSVRAVFNMQTYMQAILLTTITEMQQIMALKNFQRHMGKRIGFVKASKGPLKGSQLSNLKQYKQDMLDYGLTADIDLDTAEGQAAFNAGAVRFVDQVITRPNDATTAKIFKNPMTAPIFLFKRFITTYSNTLLNSIVTDIATKVDNKQRAKQIGQLAVTAASMYGAVMFAEIMKGAIKGDLEDDDFKVNPEDFKTFMRRLDRTGLVSAPGAMALNLAAPYKSWGGEKGSDRLVELGGVFASDMKATLDFYLSKKGEKDFNRLFGQLFPTSRMFMGDKKDEKKKTDKKKRKSNMSYTVAE